jgi:hypothetical protein
MLWETLLAASKIIIENPFLLAYLLMVLVLFLLMPKDIWR